MIVRIVAAAIVAKYEEVCLLRNLKKAIDSCGENN